MLDRSVDRYTAMDSWNNGQLTFFDRGILDTLCYARLIEIDITATMDHYAKHYTYNPTVFILPPWADIYETDNERKQTWEEAVQTYEVMSDTYRLYGYEVIEVPRIAIEDRLAFVLGKIE
jgi:predicted ATPase